MAQRAHTLRIADDKRQERVAMHIQCHRDAFSAAHCIGVVKDVSRKSQGNRLKIRVTNGRRAESVVIL